MVRRTLVIRTRLDGVREVLAALRVLPAEASKEMRDATERISKAIAVVAVADVARNGGAQGPLLAPTVKAVRDRVPAVQVGGTKRVGRKRAPAYGVLFGSTFGAHGRFGWYGAPEYRGSVGRQYRPHMGAAAYDFFPLLESEAPVISRYFNNAADRVVRKWAS